MPSPRPGRWPLAGALGSLRVACLHRHPHRLVICLGCPCAVDPVLLGGWEATSTSDSGHAMGEVFVAETVMRFLSDGGEGGTGTGHSRLSRWFVELLSHWEAPVTRAAEAMSSLWHDSPEEPHLWSPGPTVGLEVAGNPVRCCFWAPARQG